MLQINNIMSLWYRPPFNFMGGYRHFGGTCCLCLRKRW